MSRSKIEIFLIGAARARKTGPRRAIRPLAALVLAAFALPSAPAHAATPSVVLFADRDIDDQLSRAAEDLAAKSARFETTTAAADVACAAAPDRRPRLALVSDTLSQSYVEACRHSADARVASVVLGHRAIALVAPARSPIWPVSSAALFRALTEHTQKPQRPASWSDLDASYPKLPIGLLLAPSGSAAERIFAARVMVPPCRAAAGGQLPFDAGNGIGYCSALRGDLPAVQRQGDSQDWAGWVASAPDGELAVMRLTELRRLDGLVVALPLDGTLPTAANIASGRYAAAERIGLLIVVPNGTSESDRGEARDLAFALLAETSIGPDGALVSAGLVPLAASERVASRSQALTLLGQR